VLFDLAEAKAESGAAGLVVAEHSAPALAAAMLALLDDPARAAAMGAHGRAEAERRFRWEGEAERLVAAYARALAAPGAGR
jgi:glycosyltransferase involved in cell wall biosynthesis